MVTVELPALPLQTSTPFGRTLALRLGLAPSVAWSSSGDVRSQALPSARAGGGSTSSVAARRWRWRFMRLSYACLVPLLQLSEVSLAYGHVPLLDHADLVVEPGEHIGLIGRNGTGKSSLLRIVAGAVR